MIHLKSSIYCRLINSIGGKTPANGLKPQKLAFKKMESINMFLEAATQYGVPTTELFQTVDLYEKQNLNQVVICLQSLARKVILRFDRLILQGKNPIANKSSRPHWLCRYLRILPVLHTPILWNKTADVVGIFIFVGVNNIKKKCRVPN